MALCNQKRYDLDFEVYGEGFPFGRNDGWFSFKTTEDQYMTVDYNDGSQPVKYPMRAGWYTKLQVADYPNTVMDPYGDVPSGVDLKYKGKYFEDGNTGSRIVTISFENHAAITSVYHYLVWQWTGIYPVNILKYTNIEAFRVGYANKLDSLPEDLITLTKISILELGSSFIDSGYFRREIPDGIFNLALTNLGLTSMFLGEVFSEGKTGNLDKLHLFKHSLHSLKLNGCKIIDNSIPQSVQDAILQCDKLTHFYIDTNRMTTVPEFVNQMTSLQLIYVGGGYGWDGYLTDWGDLSNLSKLQSFYCPVASHAPVTIPPYLKEFPLLKSMYMDGTYDTQERWDPWVANLYDYIVSNAPITNDDINNPVGARNFMVSADRYSATYIVEGEYQQPQGYVQGSSNGTPTTQLEKLWVLQNQYNVTVQYKDNRP